MIKNLAIGLGLIFITSIAFAEVPIVDLSQVGVDSSAQEMDAQTQAAPDVAAPTAVSTESATVATPQMSTDNMSVDERLKRLENQVQTVQETNLTGKINQLEQQLQKANGQVEINTHDIQMLQKEIHDFYQNLEQRLNQLKNGAAVNGSTATSAPKTDAAQADPKEKAMYDSAFNLLQKKKYDGAIKKFASYIAKYPNGTYVVNSHYWLGEINYLKSRFWSAAKHFKIIIDQYPKSIKLPDAMLKIAIIHSAQGKKDLAKKEFLKIEKRFPHTTTAKMARQEMMVL